MGQKYFIDTEFLEGTQKTFFGKSKPTIDLISIGIVDEEGREYYAISKDFNLKEAWNRFQIERTKTGNNPYKVYWIRENVLEPIFIEWKQNMNGKIVRLGLPIWLNEKEFTYKNFKYMLKSIGKSNKEIAEEVKDFCYNQKELDELYSKKQQAFLTLGKKNIEFYGYYSAYDWVVFCWLFGKMIDLPNGFPMYCIDLKQELDEIQEKRFGLSMFKGGLTNNIKDLPKYPKKTNEHNALQDARWNLSLYKFIQTLK